MTRFHAAIAACVLAFGAVATQPALADWRYRGHRQYHHYDHGGAAVLGGALLGLGVGAALGAVLAPPPVIYAPPPVFYYPPPPQPYWEPAYAAPPPYYAPQYAAPAPDYAPPAGYYGGMK